MASELEQALRRVADHFRYIYRVELQDLDISDTPGYWRDKELHQHPNHPLHGFMFCEGPFKATYYYEDGTRDLKTGRFLSPHQTWRLIHDATAVKA